MLCTVRLGATDQPCRGGCGVGHGSPLRILRTSSQPRRLHIAGSVVDTLARRSHGAGSCRNGGGSSCRYRDAADGPIEGVFDFVALGVRPVDAASVTRRDGCAGWYTAVVRHGFETARGGRVSRSLPFVDFSWVGSIADEARCFFYFAMADADAHHRPSAGE